MFAYERPPRLPSYRHIPKTTKHDEKIKLYLKRIKNFSYGSLLLEEEMNKLKLRENIEKEAISNASSRASAQTKVVNTTDIEANDPDIESRLRSFTELSKRLQDHLEDMGGLTRGSDYKTSMYLQKLNLLSKKGGHTGKYCRFRARCGGHAGIY